MGLSETLEMGWHVIRTQSPQPVLRKTQELDLHFSFDSAAGQQCGFDQGTELCGHQAP